MLILVLLGMYFDAEVVFVTKSSLLFRLAVAILWHYQGSDTSTSPRAILVHSYYMSPQSLIPAVYLVIFQLHIFSVHKVGMATIKGVQI